MAAPDHFGRGGAWAGGDWLIAAALFLATLLSRIPFRTGLFYAWDSVLYARAIEDFNVTLDQPQPPGHIFYVGLVWFVDRLTGDANAAMVWISVFASAAAVVALFWLGREMFGRATGLLAAAFLATSLSFWAHGEVAYPYTLLAFLTTAVAALIYRAWQGRSGYVLPSTLAFGLAAGFRQDLLFFMLPLWLGSLAGKSWRLKAGAAALLVTMTAAWYVPSALLSGGFTAYREASSRQSDYLMQTASVFGKGAEALSYNLSHLGRFLLYALAGATVLAVYFLVKLALGRARLSPGDRRLIFLLVWIAPSALFYIFMHIGEFGYVFTILPAMLLVAALGVIELASDLGRAHAGGRRRNAVLMVLAGLVLGVNLALFLVLTPHLSANRLAANEDIQRTRIEAIRENFDSGSTLLVSTYNYQQARYYLPGYRHWYVDPVTAVRPSLKIPPGVEWVVLFDESLGPSESAERSSLPLTRGQQLDYLIVDGEQFILVDWAARRVSLVDQP